MEYGHRPSRPTACTDSVGSERPRSACVDVEAEITTRNKRHQTQNRNHNKGQRGISTKQPTTHRPSKLPRDYYEYTPMTRSSPNLDMQSIFVIARCNSRWPMFVGCFVTMCPGPLLWFSVSCLMALVSCNGFSFYIDTCASGTFGTHTIGTSVWPKWSVSMFHLSSV